MFALCMSLLWATGTLLVLGGVLGNMALITSGAIVGIVFVLAYFIYAARGRA